MSSISLIPSRPSVRRQRGQIAPVALFGVSKRIGKWPLVPGQGIPHYTEYITRVD